MITITFDDGYKDNLLNALPILEKLKIPASIYITTRFLNKEVDIWWYEINDVIQNQSNLSFNYEKTFRNIANFRKYRKYCCSNRT